MQPSFLNNSNVVVGNGGLPEDGKMKRFVRKVWSMIPGRSLAYKGLALGGIVILCASITGLLVFAASNTSPSVVLNERGGSGSTESSQEEGNGSGSEPQGQGGGNGSEAGDQNNEEKADEEKTPANNKPSGGGSGSGNSGGGGSSGGNSGGSGSNGGDGGNGGSSCALPNFPNESCTGWQHTGVTLSAYTGPTNITTDGTVIDGKSIDTCLAVNANNVTIKRSRIRCADWWVVRMHGNNVLIEDTEIDALGFTGANCLEGNNYTARRINCHNTGDGIRLGSNVIIEDSMIHNLVTEPGSHNDSIQSTGSINSVIRHNYIENQYSQTACIKLGDEFGPLQHVLVENNLLNGGGYTIYGGGTDTDINNLRFLNNRFMRSPHGGFFANGGHWGPVAYYNPSLPGNQWSGNVWHDNGVPITP